jgi:GxxExxY protein
LKYKELTAKIIECAFRVHRKLGFGFLEAVYQNALMVELEKAGLEAVKQKSIQIHYDREIIGDYTADIVVEDKVILELKAVKEIHPVHEAQLVNYLKATGMEVGLLINFGDRVEIKRKVLDRPLND